MSLITGSALVKERFFSAGNARPNGASFDLTIGAFFDSDGKRIDGDYLLEPGNMVQVVSAEIFNLPNTVTGHVTYKTTLTKQGIWALTIGIVDPGWNGPVTTSLLNFSKVTYLLHTGAPFLRVSLFEHPPIDSEYIHKERSLDAYMREAQNAALNTFPRTFLNVDQIAQVATENIFEKIRKRVGFWIATIGVVFAFFTIFFTVIQIIQNSTNRISLSASDDDFGRMRTRVELLETRLNKLEATRPDAVGHAAIKDANPRK